MNAKQETHIAVTIRGSNVSLLGKGPQANTLTTLFGTIMFRTALSQSSRESTTGINRVLAFFLCICANRLHLDVRVAPPPFDQVPSPSRRRAGTVSNQGSKPGNTAAIIMVEEWVDTDMPEITNQANATDQERNQAPCRRRTSPSSHQGTA